MKTAVTVLQEMMVKIGQTPEYECVSQTGPQHQAMFDYRCMVCGVVVTASARSKKEAKQEVARLMLLQLSRRGHVVPPAYTAPPASLHGDPLMGSSASVDSRSYVALLRELCEQYRLASVGYELVGDTGPPHLRHFTVRARIGEHVRIATSTTKKTARQLAAKELYSYLRQSLARITQDFDEEAALVRAHERVMNRHCDDGDDGDDDEDEDAPYRIDLNQKISEYHLGITTGLEPEARAAALQVLEQASALSPEAAVAAVAAALNLRTEAGVLEPLHLLTLSGTSPELTFAGDDPAEAAAAALAYLGRALRYNPVATAPPDVSAQPAEPACFS